MRLIHSSLVVDKVANQDRHLLDVMQYRTQKFGLLSSFEVHTKLSSFHNLWVSSEVLLKISKTFVILYFGQVTSKSFRSVSQKNRTYSYLYLRKDCKIYINFVNETASKKDKQKIVLSFVF